MHPCFHANPFMHPWTCSGIQYRNHFLNHIWTATQEDSGRVVLHLIRMQHRNRTPLLSTRLYTGVRWLRLRFTLCPRPLLGFVQIGLFASPELPISSQRHQRREGMLTSEQSQSARLGGVRWVSFSIAYTDMRRINPPRPPFYSIPPPLALFFTSVLARWEPPYTGGVPAYISYRLAMLLHQIYGLLISGQKTASAAADWLNLRPGGKIHQSSGPQPEPGAVAEPQGETRERQAKGEEQPYSGHVLRWHTCEHPWTLLEKSFTLFLNLHRSQHYQRTSETVLFGSNHNVSVH